ncbi:unnamed protein product [Lymnaea stagnalis]|uniref:BPTI/Kunitz inhibitor domain-containing protein n=1 Tax=Lymnaea stagnalis TaxID=6523 RepID=A0AAV2GYB2_LYMST
MAFKVYCVFLLGVCLQLSAQQSPDYCSLAPVSGMCEAYIPSFYYNPTYGSCMKFIYGGCGGNQNRFSTAVECETVCKPQGAL